MPALRDKLIKLREANAVAATALTTLTLKRDERAAFFDHLSKVTSDIKEAVKGQYTFSSSEFKLVKGIVV